MREARHSGRAPAAVTLFEKIWQEHVVAPEVGEYDNALATGEKAEKAHAPTLELATAPSLLAIDRIFLHERTGSIALKNVRERACSVMDPARVFCTIDHIVDTRPGRTDATLVPGGRKFIVETRDAARAAGYTVVRH